MSLVVLKSDVDAMDYVDMEAMPFPKDGPDGSGAELPAPKWQPIKTAPNDGTRVLLALADKNGKIEYVDTGWYYFFDDDDAAGYWTWCTHQDLEYPTHWMPLESKVT